MTGRPSLLDVFPRRRLRAGRAPRSLAATRGIWTTPRTWSPGELVTALQLNQHIRDNLSILKTSVNDDGTPLAFPLTQTFRGLHLRTNPDANHAADQVSLLGLDDVIMSDGVRYSGLTLPLTADMSVGGAGGLDTGSRTASAWYEVHLIGQSTSRAPADLRLVLHRAKNYSLDQSQTSTDATATMNPASGAAALVAQSFKTTNTGPVEAIDLQLTRLGALGASRVWLTLEANVSSAPSGTPLATSDKLDASTVSTTAQAVRFVFRAPATLTAATTYWFVVHVDYAASDTLCLKCAYNTTSAYANGGLGNYNGTTWTTFTADLWFKIYVTQNTAALTFPTGYDESCKLGYVYNASGNVLTGFRAIDHVVTIFPVSFLIGVTNTVLALADVSPYVPPGAIDVQVELAGSVAGDIVGLTPVPDGFSTASQGVFLGVSASSLSVIGSIQTEYQGLFSFRFSGTGTYSLAVRGYRW